ncbi:hypothetical protein MUK42_32537 [Musa troglodytarum]|uniref:Uncharacterized protein n=1 Tax=Musa troglodytarum TaxID=320322 RepID=A0A9E7I876_9LILI|nr:hypothetical protein MUK42_32537 [Musa troglodytarum]
MKNSFVSIRFAGAFKEFLVAKTPEGDGRSFGVAYGSANDKEDKAQEGSSPSADLPVAVNQPFLPLRLSVLLMRKQGRKTRRLIYYR